MRKLLILAAVLALCGGTYGAMRFWKKANDGFSINTIYSKLPNSPDWDIATTEKQRQEVNQILMQPFFYIGRGFQFYAFESSDGKYVVKFLRHQRLHAPVLYDWLPNCALVSTLKAKKCQKRAERVQLIFNSLKLAYENIPEETGLVYVHINKTQKQHGSVFLEDLLENQYQVPLDETEFVVQYKASFVKPTLKALMKAGKLDEAKERINQLFTLLADTAKKGIVDIDGALIRKNNVGFIQDRAIYIDTGTFVVKENANTKERFQDDLRRLRPLYRWLAAHYPPLAAHFDKQQKKVVETF